MNMADFDSYVETQKKGRKKFSQQKKLFARMNLWLTPAKSEFSRADRSVKEYAKNIWKLRGKLSN